MFSLMFKYILCNTFGHVGVNLMHAIKCKCLFGFGSCLVSLECTRVDLASFFNLPTPLELKAKRPKRRQERTHYCFFAARYVYVHPLLTELY